MGRGGGGGLIGYLGFEVKQVSRLDKTLFSSRLCGPAQVGM